MSLNVYALLLFYGHPTTYHYLAPPFGGYHNFMWQLTSVILDFHPSPPTLPHKSLQGLRYFHSCLKTLKNVPKTSTSRISLRRILRFAFNHWYCMTFASTICWYISHLAVKCFLCRWFSHEPKEYEYFFSPCNPLVLVLKTLWPNSRCWFLQPTIEVVHAEQACKHHPDRCVFQDKQSLVWWRSIFSGAESQLQGSSGIWRLEDLPVVPLHDDMCESSSGTNPSDSTQDTRMMLVDWKHVGITTWAFKMWKCLHGHWPGFDGIVTVSVDSLCITELCLSAAMSQVSSCCLVVCLFPASEWSFSDLKQPPNLSCRQQLLVSPWGGGFSVCDVNTSIVLMWAVTVSVYSSRLMRSSR